MRRWGSLFLWVGLGLLGAGCPKGKPDYNQGKKAETLQDYDAAFVFYQKAAKADPYNANYKIKLNRVRFEASELHVKHGVELRKQGDLQGAAGEFQRAQTIDPSSPVADQELRKTVEMIADKNRAADAAAEPPTEPNETPLAAMPPEIKGLNIAPTNPPAPPPVAVSPPAPISPPASANDLSKLSVPPPANTGVKDPPMPVGLGRCGCGRVPPCAAMRSISACGNPRTTASPRLL